MVLAAGLGTRMLPLTSLRPKCLMPVMNRPLLGLWLERLAGLGVERAVVNTHHLADRVREFLAGHGPSVLEVVLSHEPVILGTGGGLVAARPLLDQDPFLLVNADAVCAADLWPLLKALKNPGVLAALGLADAPRFNTVAVGEGGAVLGFAGDDGLPGSVRWRTYAGLAALRPQLLDFLPAHGYSTLVEGLKAALAAGRAVAGVELEGFWDDLGTPRAFLDLHRALVQSPPEGLRHLAPASPLVLAPGAAVEPGARVEGFAVLGEDAVVEPGALVADSVLLPGARALAGARVRGAILGDGFEARGEIVGGAHA